MSYKPYCEFTSPHPKTRYILGSTTRRHCESANNVWPPG